MNDLEHWDELDADCRDYDYDDDWPGNRPLPPSLRNFGPGFAPEGYDWEAGPIE
jgi:hypothetical protein